MKKTLLLALALIAVGCGPEPRDVRTLQEVDGVLMNPVDGQPYSGPVFRENNGRRISASLTDGKLDGIVESYYENGQLRERGPFKDGIPDGPSEGYHEDGQLWMKGTYKDGELDGPLERYYEDGQLMKKGMYKDGKKCGEWFEEGETVTYDPCPPNLEDGN